MSDFTVIIKYLDGTDKELLSDYYPLATEHNLTIIRRDSARVIRLNNVSEVIVETPKGFFDFDEKESDLEEMFKTFEEGLKH